jgi:cell division septation protein DedD
MAYQLDPVGPDDRAGIYAVPQREDEGGLPLRRGLLATALTLLVMGAFAGGLWFAYQQGRHAAGGGDGDVPLLRADTRPMKVKPDNPGGMPIPDRDKLIYSEAKPAVERLLPPPEKPMPKPTAPPPSAASPPAIAAAPPPQPVSAPQQPAVAPTAKPVAPAMPPVANAARPGGVRIQLGSLRSEDLAREEWERLKKKNADLLGKLTANTTRADLGDKGIYYRITAGPVADKPAAERICGELQQRSVGCAIAR